MAPLKVKQMPITSNRLTRSRLKEGSDMKRKAESSPAKDQKTKRSALGDLTTNANVAADRNKLTIKKQIVKKVTTVQTKQIVKKTTVQQLSLPKAAGKAKNNENLAPPAAPFVRIKARQPIRGEDLTALKPKEAPPKENHAKVKRLSNEFEKTQESLYASALEESTNSVYYSAKCDVAKPSSSADDDKSTSVSFVAAQLEKRLNLGNHEVPDGILDFDKENWNDELQASQYAMDIFNYLREQEEFTQIKDYMDRQSSLTTWMRALLVDWMVEIQESFELNHETLYLAVKLVDSYLSKVTVAKDNLQLVGSAAMFVASKYDERIPPYIDDFLYICDGAYKRNELIRMEISILKVCDFRLGVPISYRFLRRYARCAKVSMVVLTLARYILETSLMNYACISIKDSLLAAASLYLALKMKNVGGWTKTLEFYSGYALSDILETAKQLNRDLHVRETKPRHNLKTIFNKYSHKVFYEVAKTALLKTEDLDKP